MQIAGFVVDHSAAHRNGVLQHFVSDAELLKRVNPARRERKIDRPSADNIAFTRISPPLVKIDIVPAPAQICGEQSSCEAAADENEFRWHSPEFLIADYADITDIQIKQLARSSPMTQGIVA
jgi:hypothetical protein